MKRRPAMRSMKQYAAFLLLFCAALFSGHSPAQEVVQTLRSGATIFGTIAGEDTGEDTGTVTIDLHGGGKLVLDASLVKKRDTPSADLVEWRAHAPLLPDTVEEHQNMVSWCRDRNLTDQARLHAERIIELDPENDAARKFLGHVKLDGVWMTPVQRKEQLGYTSFGGKSVTQQEELLLRQKQEDKKAVGQWKRQIKANLPLLRQRDPGALDFFRQIRDPRALAAITDFLRKEDDPQIRVLLVQAMGGLGTPAAYGDLATVSVIDDDYEVRRTALEQIGSQPNVIPSVIQFYRHRLNNPDNETINRAAAALAFLNAGETIPDLINSLVTSHQRTVTEGGDRPIASFSNEGFSFNPGGAVTKTVTDTIENSDVLAALQQLVERNLPPAVDFGFDIDAWRTWYFHRMELDGFDTRRSL